MQNCKGKGADATEKYVFSSRKNTTPFLILDDTWSLPQFVMSVKLSQTSKHSPVSFLGIFTRNPEIQNQEIQIWTIL